MGNDIHSSYMYNIMTQFTIVVFNNAYLGGQEMTVLFALVNLLLMCHAKVNTIKHDILLCWPFDCKVFAIKQISQKKIQICQAKMCRKFVKK